MTAIEDKRLERTHKEHAIKAHLENDPVMSAFHTRMSKMHRKFHETLSGGPKAIEGKRKDLEDTYRGILGHFEPEKEPETTASAPATTAPVSKTPRTRKKKTVEPKQQENKQPENPLSKPLKLSETSDDSKKSSRAKTKQEIEKDLYELGREAQHSGNEKNMKGVHTKEGDFTKPGLEPYVQSQKVREQAKKIKPNLTRSEKMKKNE